jgi:hypothetical protein
MMPRPDLDAIRTRQAGRWWKVLRVSATLGDEITKTDGMLNDIDALLTYVDELEGKQT